ncbi:hypothetical protein ILYODFUR_024545 [Ilyodon furcidens]|uniref:Uncharacterized protein n=1 Tax=Ilyodon furcidens TaxID=33524 RepID=A0ABV0V6I7_9TELE
MVTPHVVNSCSATSLLTRQQLRHNEKSLALALWRQTCFNSLEYYSKRFNSSVFNYHRSASETVCSVVVRFIGWLVGWRLQRQGLLRDAASHAQMTLISSSSLQHGGLLRLSAETLGHTPSFLSVYQ